MVGNLSSAKVVISKPWGKLKKPLLVMLKNVNVQLYMYVTLISSIQPEEYVDF